MAVSGTKEIHVMQPSQIESKILYAKTYKTTNCGILRFWVEFHQKSKIIRRNSEIPCITDCEKVPSNWEGRENPVKIKKAKYKCETIEIMTEKYPKKKTINLI